MQPYSQSPHPYSDPSSSFGSPTRKSGNGVVWAVLGTVAGLIFLACGGVLAGIMYLGFYAPETSVYTGNQVPRRFIDTAKEVGALDDGETILYFYSDALTDIRDGFYFVSDRRVVIYSEATGDTSLTAIRFDEIDDLELFRNESFVEDSQITIFLKSGELVSFPVSSEYGRDQDFYDAIRDRMPPAR